MGLHSGEKIAAALRQVELLKVEILGRLADLYRLLLQGGEGRLQDALAALLLSVLLLSRRLGLSYRDLKKAVLQQIRRRLREEEQEELRRDLQDLKGLLETAWKGDQTV